MRVYVWYWNLQIYSIIKCSPGNGRLKKALSKALTEASQPVLLHLAAQDTCPVVLQEMAQGGGNGRGRVVVDAADLPLLNFPLFLINQPLQ